MDKQMIEEMAKIFCSRYKNGRCDVEDRECSNRCTTWHRAENLYNAGYRKIPENAVVLTEENMEQTANWLVTHPKMQATMEKLIKTWRKETAEKFAERLKEKFAYDIERCKVVDEICKELEGENGSHN